MLYPASRLRESVSASLDMVYYCWLEERQLARGAKYLLQVSHIASERKEKKSLRFSAIKLGAYQGGSPELTASSKYMFVKQT